MNDVLRTAIMRIMSEMLDDPDEHGIYPTGRFMGRIEALLVSMMAAPDVMQLSGSEALFGFMGWLTSRDKPVTASATHDAAVWADLVGEYIKANGLSEPRSEWHLLLTQPVDEAA